MGKHLIDGIGTAKFPGQPVRQNRFPGQDGQLPDFDKKQHSVRCFAVGIDAHRADIRLFHAGFCKQRPAGSHVNTLPW